MIGTIPDGDHAERFSDYLTTRDIDNMIEQTSAGDFGVWVEHDDNLDRARRELEAFLRNPEDAPYRKVSRAADRLRRQEEQKQTRLRKRFIDVRTSWARTRQWHAPLTIALVAISVAISLAGNSIQLFHRPPNRLIEYLMFAPVNQAKMNQFAHAHPRVSSRTAFAFQYWLDTMRQGQVWRLIGDIFVHWGPLHLLFDMIWLADLGAMIETRRGTWILLGLVLVTAILSNFAQYMWAFPVPSGGMSGVVYGLFGYIWMKQRFQPHLNLAMSQQTIWIMIGWMFLCMTGMLGPIGNAAHVSGLIIGCAIGYLPYQYRKLRRS